MIILVIAAIHGMCQSISAEQNYAANSPGVVMVQTVFSATVYVNKVEMNQRRFTQLVDSVQRLDTTGTLITAEKKLDIVVRALYNNPIRFLDATAGYYRQQHRILSAGTGSFISGDGFILTNCHIVDRDSAFIRQKFILSTFQEVIDANIRSLQSSWAMTLSDEQRNLLYNAYTVIYAQVSSMILFDLRREIYIQFRANTNDDKLVIRRLPARLVIKGKPMPGKDIAILKVDSVQELPALRMSEDSIPRIGGQVLVYGYPEPVTSNIFLDRETTIEPTLTAGVISAIKKTTTGWPVIQMDAVISHGSSGSPVCNDNGEVIGIATFGTLEQNTGTLANGYNFAIPLSVVQEYLDSAHAQAHISLSSLIWQQGLDFFYKGYYFKALAKFKAVKKESTNYPELYYYLDACQKRIAAGDDRESFMQKSIFRIIAFLLLIVGIVVFFRWQREKHNNR
ncbi:MAG: serine protease [Chitinophagaceae bacterium]